MPQGIIQVSPVGLQDHIDLTIDPALIDLGKLKEVLLLPDRYTVEQVKPDKFHYSDGHGYVEVIVSSPDIPEVPDGEALPIVTPWYYREESDYETMTCIAALTDIKVNDVSVFREEDKQCKRTIALKSIDASVDSSARDTQFKGVAKLLMGDLDTVSTTTYASIDKAKEAYELAIARRFYDFTKHAFYELDIWRNGSLDSAVQCIPDLNKWPDEAEYPRTNQ